MTISAAASPGDATRGSDSEDVKSPCISVCVLNGEDVCEGCYRSAQEITEWSVLSNEQKRVVMLAVKSRCERLTKHKLL